MKRRLTWSDISTKKQRVEINLLTLPTDVQQLIFNYLTSVDIINLSCLNKGYRDELISFIFRNTKTTWLNLINDKTFLTKYKHLINQLRIIDYYSYGEWQVDFNQHISVLPNLKHLLINSGNSSNWLKYRSNNQVNELTLYFDEDNHLNASALPSMKNPRIFNLNHVKNFSSLQKLYLSNYHFNWETNEVSTSIHLTELSLDNCSWEYPFKLTQLNLNESIKVLNVSYSKTNSFILSERFNQFLINDDETFKNLEDLSVHLITAENYERALIKGWEKVLSQNIFTKFLNKEKFPNLLNLRFHGWNLNLGNLRSSLRKINKIDNNLSLLDLKISSKKNNELIKEIKQECLSYFPMMRLKLQVLEDG